MESGKTLARSYVRVKTNNVHTTKKSPYTNSYIKVMLETKQ